jgi:hypothetical protein
MLVGMSWLLMVVGWEGKGVDYHLLIVETSFARLAPSLLFPKLA